jgi:hypothetical protein
MNINLKASIYTETGIKIWWKNKTTDHKSWLKLDYM